MQRRTLNKFEVGDKINKLTLIKKIRVILKGFNYVYYGIFRCDCGVEKKMYIHNVKHGKTKSCGCDYKISNKLNRKHTGARHKTN